MLSAKPPASNSQTVMVIILPEKSVASIEPLLDKFAMNDWRTSDTIFLIIIEDQYINSRNHIVASVRRRCKEYGLYDKKKTVRYLVFNDLNFLPKTEISWVLSADFITGVTCKLLADDLLEIRLKEWGMHWLQAATAEVKKWHHDDLSQSDIEDWLRQFDRVSGSRWVGEQLLREFRVWSSEKIASTFQEGEALESLSGQPCIIRYENGKSADSISTIIRKILPHLMGDGEVEDYRSFLEKNNNIDCYVFEDGVFTGVEISDLLCSLVGVVGGTKKCEPLTNPSQIKCRKTFIRFAIGTDIGLNRVRETIQNLNIAVEISAKEEIEVLTVSGKSALNAGSLYEQDEQGKDVLRSAESDIVPQAFISGRWGARRTDAMVFCKRIGIELFSSYQKKRGKVWTAKRLNDCALGAGNMALLLSFAHSLPKSTLPVFWCHGTVGDQNGRDYNWKPLFPSAHKT